MIVIIENLLDAEDLTLVDETLARARFRDGGASAGGAPAWARGDRPRAARAASPCA